MSNYKYVHFACCAIALLSISALAPANTIGPLHASLTHGSSWGGGKGDGGGSESVAFLVSSIGAAYSVYYDSSRYFMDHNWGSSFESDRLAELSITESSVHVVFDGTWFEYDDGEHNIYKGTLELNLERIPLTKDWTLNGQKLNHHESDEYGYHDDSYGICRVW